MNEHAHVGYDGALDAKYSGEIGRNDEIDDPILSTSVSFINGSGQGQANLLTGVFSASVSVDFTEQPNAAAAKLTSNSGVHDELLFLNPGWQPGDAPSVVTYKITHTDVDAADFATSTFSDFRIGTESKFLHNPTEHEGSFELPAITTAVPIRLSVLATAGIGPSNPAGSAKLEFEFTDIPDGVSFTSQSTKFLRADLYEPKSIIVLTHGFQPGSDPALAGTSRLPNVRAALEARLQKEGIRDDVIIYEFSWDKAFVNTGKALEDLDYYPRARAETQAAGVQLAKELETLYREISVATGRDFEPNLHFIGHSLGTLVNAHAVDALVGKETTARLGQQVVVDQVTIIDSPLDPALDGADDPTVSQSVFRHEDFFLDVLNTSHVRYVENFFAGKVLGTSTPRFGQKIDGTGPRDDGDPGGLEFSKADHLTILDAYADLIEGKITDPAGNAWNAPALESWSIPVEWKDRPSLNPPSSYLQIADAFAGSGSDMSFAFDQDTTGSTFSFLSDFGPSKLVVTYEVSSDTQIGLFEAGVLVWASDASQPAGTAYVDADVANQAEADLEWRLLSDAPNAEASLTQWLAAEGGPTGGAGHDVFFASDQPDAFDGGDGDDSFLLLGGIYDTRDFSALNISSATQIGTGARLNLEGKMRIDAIVDGGRGTDTVRLSDVGDAFFLHDAYSGFHSSVTLTGDSMGTQSTARFANLEAILGLGGDDMIDLTSPDYSLAGVDLRIEGGDGDDVIWGSDANETIYGDAGDDILFGGVGRDILVGGDGADIFEFTRTSTTTEIADFDDAEGDTIRIYSAGGAAFAPSSLSIDAAGFTLSYTDSETEGEHELRIEMAQPALSVPALQGALEFV